MAPNYQFFQGRADNLRLRFYAKASEGRFRRREDLLSMVLTPFGVNDTPMPLFLAMMRRRPGNGDSSDVFSEFFVCWEYEETAELNGPRLVRRPHVESPDR